MSSPQRRAELRAIREVEDLQRQEEEWRVANLSLAERIEECGDIHDVKAVLRIIAERAGVDLWASA